MDFNSNCKGEVFQSPNCNRAYRPAMARGRYAWGRRLDTLRLERGWSLKTLSDRTGIPYDSINKYCRGEVENPRGSAMQQLADVFGVSVDWLRHGDMSTLIFPVVGEVKGGQDWFPIDQGGDLGAIEIDLSHVDPIAIRVRGDSMKPVYRQGDSIVGSRLKGTVIDEVIGRDCIVKTLDGEGMVKTLMRGSKPGFYRLRSYDPEYPDREDVQLEWAAPVILTVRR